MLVLSCSTADSGVVTGIEPGIVTGIDAGVIMLNS
jgi:hypothetical protein